MDVLLSSSVITGVLWSGISLVTTDLWFDLRYVLAHPQNMPSRRQQALEYYRWLLQPRMSGPIPYPGWIFAAACSFYLLVCFPSINHGAMALFYSPICVRYYEMLKGVGEHALRDWHWIVAIRFVLLALGIASLQVHATGLFMEYEDV